MSSFSRSRPGGPCGQVDTHLTRLRGATWSSARSGGSRGILAGAAADRQAREADLAARPLASSPGPRRRTACHVPGERRQHGGPHLAGAARRRRGPRRGRRLAPAGRHPGRQLLPRPDRPGVPGPRDHERPPPIPRREHLHADRPGHVRPARRPPDEGRPLGRWRRSRSGPCTAGSPAASTGFVRFLRISFLDFVPGPVDRRLRPGGGAREAAVGRAGDGRRGPDLALADDLAARSPRRGSGSA